VLTIIEHDLGKCITEAIAAKLQVIGIDTRTIITKIECSLARIGSTWVSIRHKHLGQREAVEEATAIIAYIVQGKTFSVIEALSEAPFLPLDVVALNKEWWTLGLNNLVWLGGRPRVWPEVEGGIRLQRSNEFFGGQMASFRY
jgi:hypothetical protein